MTRHIKKAQQRRRLIRAALIFCSKNGQLLFLLLLMFIGALTATLLYPYLPDQFKMLFHGVTDQTVPLTNLLQGCTAVMSSAFYIFVMLAFLFLFGLTPYGCPLVLCVPTFFGYMIGLAQCRVFSSQGIVQAAVSVLFPMGIAAFAVLIGAAQSLQMSVLFSRQLLPSSAHCGGLWNDFKWYLLRYMLCVVIALIAATVKILLQYASVA